METFQVVATKNNCVISNRLISAASCAEAAEIATSSHRAEGWNLYRVMTEGKTVHFETVLHLLGEVDAEEIRLCGVTPQKFWAAEIRTQWKVTPL